MDLSCQCDVTHRGPEGWHSCEGDATLLVARPRAQRWAQLLLGPKLLYVCDGCVLPIDREVGW